jgi:hypothetical protein
MSHDVIDFQFLIFLASTFFIIKLINKSFAYGTFYENSTSIFY